MSRSRTRNVHVVARDHEWAIRRTGSQRARKRFPNKAAAVGAARVWADALGVGVCVFDQQGRIQRRYLPRRPVNGAPDPLHRAGLSHVELHDYGCGQTVTLDEFLLLLALGREYFGARHKFQQWRVYPNGKAGTVLNLAGDSPWEFVRTSMTPGAALEMPDLSDLLAVWRAQAGRPPYRRELRAAILEACGNPRWLDGSPA